MKTSEFVFIVISPPDILKSETMHLLKMLDAGLQYFHIRKPGKSPEEIRKYISGIDSRYHSRLILHQAFELAAEFGVGGLHLNAKNSKAGFRRSFQPGVHRLSASFHSLSQIKSSRRKYNYVFLSPAFDSISKVGYLGKGLFPIPEWVLKKDMKVIALGGITPERISLVKKSGYSGIGMLGFIWESADPVAQFRLAQEVIS